MRRIALPLLWTLSACGGPSTGDDGQFLVGGTVTGLAGTGLVLHNGSEDLPVAVNGAFAFPTPVPDGGHYAVSVRTQPASPWQACDVAGGAGVVEGSQVTTVMVACTTNAYAVGGTVSGLRQGGLELAQGHVDALTLDASGAYQFPTMVASGSGYAVSVTVQPPTEACAVSGALGHVSSGPVTNADVTCACRSGLADCNGLPSDGCEVSIDGDVANCGACANACSAAHGIPACVGGACAVQSCEAGWYDLDSQAANGCECPALMTGNTCPWSEILAVPANGTVSWTSNLVPMGAEHWFNFRWGSGVSTLGFTLTSSDVNITFQVLPHCGGSPIAACTPSGNVVACPVSNGTNDSFFVRVLRSAGPATCSNYTLRVTGT